MKLNTQTAIIVVLLLTGAYLYLGSREAAPRMTELTSCTYSEPTTFNELQTKLNASTGTVFKAASITPWIINYDASDTVMYNYSFPAWSVTGAGSYGSDTWLVNLSNVSCDHLLTGIYLHGKNTTVGGWADIMIGNRRIVRETTAGATAWCNKADTILFVGDGVEQFANYTKTYQTCTNRTVTATEQACEASTQPAIWNGTACQCVVTKYALDATVGTATCAAKTKDLNETCNTGIGETCVTDTKCDLEKDATIGTCVARTWLDKTIDYIKDHTLMVIGIAAAILVLGNVLFYSMKGSGGKRKVRPAGTPRMRRR